MPTTLGGRLPARSRPLDLGALALQEVPDFLAGIRHAVPGVVLRVGDQLRLGAGATVGVALTTRDVVDRWLRCAAVAGLVAVHQARDAQVRAAAVAGAAVVAHHRVAGAVHHEDRDRQVLAAGVHRVVVGPAHGCDTREDVWQVAGDDGSHAATVGVAGRVDAAAVDVVGAVNLVDDLGDEAQVLATAHAGVRRPLPAVVDGLRVNADGLACRTSLVQAGVTTEVLRAIAPAVKAEDHRGGAGRVVVSRDVHDVPAATAGGLGVHVDGLAVADARSRLRVVWATLRNWCWRARQAGTRRAGVLHPLAVRQADVPEVRQLDLRELEVGRLWD